MANPFVHIEIHSRDLATTSKFYGGLFGWKLEHDPKMNYTMFETGKQPGGGMFQHDGLPPGVTVYVGVKDVEEALRKAASLGARVLQQKMEIPGIGWWGAFEAPDGTSLAVFESVPRPRRRPAARKPARRRTRR